MDLAKSSDDDDISEGVKEVDSAEDMMGQGNEETLGKPNIEEDNDERSDFEEVKDENGKICRVKATSKSAEDQKHREKTICKVRLKKRHTENWRCLSRIVCILFLSLYYLLLHSLLSFLLCLYVSLFAQAAESH